MTDGDTFEVPSDGDGDAHEVVEKENHYKCEECEKRVAIPSGLESEKCEEPEDEDYEAPSYV